MNQPVTITQRHLDMLACLCEFLEVEEDHGFVPCFNAKRPFGNSGNKQVACDIARLFGEYTDDLYDDGDQLHALLQELYECTDVLRFILTRADLSDVLGQKTTA